MARHDQGGRGRSSWSAALPPPPRFEPLEARRLLSTVEVFAAGFEGDERMELSVRGAVVAAFDRLGTGADAGAFVRRVWSTTEPLSANDVRVAFVNDRFEPANGTDRNLRVDAIVIDGVRYKTAAAGVYSTATWRAADGIVPGFGRGDVLHANGAFAYSGPPVTPPPPPAGGGSTVRVLAAGSTGRERIELQIDGRTVAGFANLGTGYARNGFVARTYVSDDRLTADRVRVAFVNDRWAPDRGIDRNVRIDRIEIDGRPFESESDGTFSTGTWRPGDGVVAGFGRGDTLQVNGYFAYGGDDAPPPPPPPDTAPGRVQFVDARYRVSEAADAVELRLERRGGRDGAVTATWTTVAGTAEPGEDFRPRSGTVNFTDGQAHATLRVPLIDDARPEAEETFAVSLTGTGGGAALGLPRTRTVIVADDDAGFVGNGLLAEFFRRRDFADPLLRRTDATVDFDFGTGSPAPGVVPADGFAARWSGRVVPPATGDWTFRTLSDDGVRLSVDGRRIIDNFTDHGATFDAASVRLTGGVPVDVELAYYEDRGRAAARLFWSGPGTPEQIIPQSALFSEPPVAVTPVPRLTGTTLADGLDRPTDLKFAANGVGFVLTQPGRVYLLQDNALTPRPILDLRERVNFVQDRGAISLAVHPELARSPYLYVAYTYDPPETAGRTGLAGPDGSGNRAARVERFTLDAATGHRSVVPGSGRVILGRNSTWANIVRPVRDSTNDLTLPASGYRGGDAVRDFVATDSRSHTVAGMAFGIDGALYVATGDASSFGDVDPRAARVQDLDNLSGKVLRIDPQTGAGLPDNPFYAGDADANRAKVYAFGLRNPFRIAVNPATGRVFVGEVGWTRWEEVDRLSVGGGDNFGWPFYEGGPDGENLPTAGYASLPDAGAFYAADPDVTAPLYARSHADGARAVSLGTFNAGGRYDGLRNTLIFSDFVEGRLQAMFFDVRGNPARVAEVSEPLGTLSSVTPGPGGALYYTDLFGGRVGRVDPAARG